MKISPKTAKTPQEAAKVYPSNWWFSLLEVPPASAFPGTGPAGNQISRAIKTQDEYLFQMNGCLRCHQFGNLYTRMIPEHTDYANMQDSWDKRVGMGQRANEMNSLMTSFGRPAGLKMFTDWTSRIAAGEVPPSPKRPEGVEQFGFDPKNTLYVSSPSGSTYSFINTKQFLATGNGELSQGWCPQVVDTNGDGKITKPWNEPARRRAEDEEGDAAYDNFDPKKDTRVEIGGYGIIVNKLDGSVWGAQESYPGKIIRMDFGKNPPETCIAEVYEVPSERWGATGRNDLRGSKPRGIDVDKKGVIWTALSASGQMASFDRSKCKQTSKGPEAHTGRTCLEGWKIYPLPGNTYKGTKTIADYYYYNYVDQFDTMGLGEDIPIATGTGSDSLIAVIPSTARRSCSACRIRWARSTRVVWTAVLTTRAPAGRARACGRRAQQRMRSGTTKTRSSGMA